MAENGFTVYADFVQELLTAEEARRSSLEQRGLAVITSSGVLATLGFGSLAIAKKGDHIALSTSSAPLLVAGAIALLLAAAFALATNVPLRHRAVNLVTLKDKLREHTADEEKIGQIRVTSTRLQLLQTTRHGNDLKAVLCLVAMASEVVGIALLGATICLVIAGSK